MRRSNWNSPGECLSQNFSMSSGLYSLTSLLFRYSLNSSILNVCTRVSNCSVNKKYDICVRDGRAGNMGIHGLYVCSKALVVVILFPYYASQP